MEGERVDLVRVFLCGAEFGERLCICLYLTPLGRGLGVCGRRGILVDFTIYKYIYNNKLYNTMN